MTQSSQPEAQEAPASEREAFEKRFPIPANCKRCGNGYGATRYSAWETAEEHIARWEGWQARAALGKQPTQEAPSAVLSEQEIDDILMRQTSLEAAGSDVFWRADGALVAKDELRMFAWECVHAARRTQEAPADAKDAARYRWLRDKGEPDPGVPYVAIRERGKSPSWAFGSALDEAIDSALQSHQEGK